MCKHKCFYLLHYCGGIEEHVYLDDSKTTPILKKKKSSYKAHIWKDSGIELYATLSSIKVNLISVVLLEKNWSLSSI